MYYIDDLMSDKGMEFGREILKLNMLRTDAEFEYTWWMQCWAPKKPVERVREVHNDYLAFKHKLNCEAMEVQKKFQEWIGDKNKNVGDG